MLYAGLDIHKSFSQAILMTETGKIIKKQKIETSEEGMKEFFSRFDKVKVVIESTTIYECLENLGHEVKLSHPLKTKAIAYARIKTDKIDAKTLADLLRSNLLPESYIPPKSIREIRNICRECKSIVCERTRWKNRLRAELAKRGINLSINIYTEKGRKRLRSLGIPRINRIVSMIEFLGEKIKEIDKNIKEIATNISEIMLLTTIPGVGIYSATLILRLGK